MKQQIKLGKCHTIVILHKKCEKYILELFYRYFFFLFFVFLKNNQEISCCRRKFQQSTITRSCKPFLFSFLFFQSTKRVQRTTVRRSIVSLVFHRPWKAGIPNLIVRVAFLGNRTCYVYWSVGKCSDSMAVLVLKYKPNIINLTKHKLNKHDITCVP